jgi:thiamine kinase-like enzyme
MVRWMRAEITRLMELTDSVGYGVPATSAAHSDLHFWNVLVDAKDQWWVIDWDDLGLGDPASDFATLLAPLILRGDITSGSPAALLGPRDNAFAQRFAICCRAVVLDQVIDTLSDWADAEAYGERAEEVRRQKRAAHEHGLAAYHTRYLGAS